jgi:hypothetical protein
LSKWLNDKMSKWEEIEEMKEMGEIE